LAVDSMNQITDSRSLRVGHGLDPSMDWIGSGFWGNFVDWIGSDDCNRVFLFIYFLY